jgi:hypothetical protein
MLQKDEVTQMIGIIMETTEKAAVGTRRRRRRKKKVRTRIESLDPGTI